ncbi:hypothetical protein [Streptomyces sp. NPDC001820]|uniref:hypothetical protein n=1 Tax=Streptomyces sp. NPDC001820 TaxID=3364613 RepID=UPI0036BDBBE9
MAELADRLGFAGLPLRDILVYYPPAFGDAGSVFDVFVHLGHLAATTEHAVLVTGAVVLPLRHPELHKRPPQHLRAVTDHQLTW